MKERKCLWINSHTEQKAEIKGPTVLTVVSYNGTA